MAAQPIDFTSGLVPAAPTQGAGVDYSAGLVSQPSPSAIPPAAPKTGMQRANDALTGANETDPAEQSPYLGGMLSGALKSASGVVGNVLDMVTRKPAGADPASQQTAAEMDNPVAKYVDQHAKEAADWLRSGGQPQGFWENVGAVGEQALEFIGADGMLKMVKAPAAAAEGGGIAAQASEHLKQAQQAAQVLKANPRLAGLITIGLKAAKDSLSMDSLSTAARQGTAAGAQTYVRTEGDLGAAAGTGALTTAAGMAGPVMRAGAEGVGAMAGAGGRATEAASNAYSEAAQAAVKPHLEAVNAASGEPKTVMEDLGHGQGEPTGTTTPVPKIDVQNAMTKIGDFTAGRQVLKDEMSAAYDHFDKLTGGEFRKVNAQVQAADAAAATGDPDRVGDYVEAVNRMDALLDSTKGSATPEMIAAVKQGFRKYYVLGGVARALDKSLDGLPGESAVSQEQRGINGKKLLNGLSNLVLQHGRAAVTDALGGPGRLEAMQAIGNATKTNAGRAAVNKGMLNVAGYLLGAKAGYASTGHWAGGVLGGAVGAKAADVTQAAVGKVLRAMQANPTVAHNLLFAIDAGSKPENYGPFIATMIQKSETEASRERQAQQSREGDGEQ